MLRPGPNVFESGVEITFDVLGVASFGFFAVSTTGGWNGVFSFQVPSSYLSLKYNVIRSCRLTK